MAITPSAGLIGRFFTIIDRPQANFMLIPEDFAVKHLSPTAEHVSVTTNDGLKWSMELVDGPYGLSFKSGWCEFRNWYRLQVNQIIFWTVYGGNTFVASMFDYDSGCEVLRQLSQATNMAGPNIVIKEGQDLMDIGVSKTDNATDELAVIPTTYSMTKDILETTAESSNRGDCSGKINEVPNKGKSTSNVKSIAVTGILQGYPIGGIGDLKRMQQNEPVSIERVPRGPRKWFFVVIQEAHVSGFYRMYIPKDFAETNLSFGRNKRVCCVYGKNGLWDVTCNFHGGGARITTGWKQFAEDNKIGVNQGWTVNICPVDEDLWVFQKN